MSKNSYHDLKLILLERKTENKYYVKRDSKKANI